MELALLVVLRPFLYLLLFATVVYWVMKFVWWLLPAGRVREILFKKRGPWEHFFYGYLGFFCVIGIIFLVARSIGM